MNNNAVERGWQELEARIDQLHKKYFGEPQQAPEHGPADVLYLSEVLANYGEERSETK
jgi:hypothetical protein